MIIQKWYRLYKSRIELRMLTAWNIYQTLEYKGEQDQLKLNDFFLALIQNHELINPKKKSIQKSSTLDSTDMSLIDDKDSSKSQKTRLNRNLINHYYLNTKLWKRHLNQRSK